MVAPQVFHGKKLEVRVPQSSRHLERFFGASFLSSKASLNILPGSTSDRYWSQHTAFTIRHDSSVARTRPPVPLATFSISPAIAPIITVQSIIPPKHIAHIMMEMVHMKPCIPSHDSRSDSFEITGDASSPTFPSSIPLLRILNIFSVRLFLIPVVFRRRRLMRQPNSSN